MAEDKHDKPRYEWLYDTAELPLPVDEATPDDVPLSIGNWQEDSVRKHRFIKTVAVIATLAGLSLVGVKGYNYLQDNNVPNVPGGTATTPTPHVRTQAECIAQLPLKLKLGQMIMMSANATTMAESSALAAQYDVGGVILMEPVPSAGQVKDFVRAQTVSPLVSTDQEGGTVQRYHHDTLPAAADVPGSNLEALGKLLAKDDEYLRSQGINMNLAPVIDVNPVGGTSVIDTRVFSDDPYVVAQDAKLYVQTSLSAGVLPALKHFPGLGSASKNTDYGSATTASFASLQQHDLVPYQQLAGTKAAVMVGNQTVPGLTGGLPASLSRATITDLLRGTLGYQDNVVITDSLSAAAITQRYSIAEAAVRSWTAGSDIALFVLPQPGLTVRQQVGRIIHAGETAVSKGQLSKAEVDASIARIWALPQKHIDACSLLPRGSQ